MKYKADRVSLPRPGLCQVGDITSTDFSIFQYVTDWWAACLMDGRVGPSRRKAHGGTYEVAIGTSGHLREMGGGE